MHIQYYKILFVININFTVKVFLCIENLNTVTKSRAQVSLFRCLIRLVSKIYSIIQSDVIIEVVFQSQECFAQEWQR